MSNLFRVKDVLVKILALGIIFSGQLLAAPPDKTKELNTKEIELHSVIEYFSRLSNKIIIPDQDVLKQIRSRKATIILPPNLEELKQTDTLWKDIFDSILAIYGYTLVEKGEVFRLVTVKNSQKQPLPFYDKLEEEKLSGTSERIITQVIVLEHVIVDSIRAMFKHVSEITPPITLSDKRTLIVTTYESNLKYFLRLIKVIDTPKEVPYIKIYDLVRVSSSQFRSQIQTYFNGIRARRKGAVDQSTTPIYISDDASNRLLVSATRKYHQIIEEFVEFFDKPIKEDLKFRPIEIYRLQNSNAKTVAEKLGKILKAKSSSSATAAKSKTAKKEDIPTIVPFEELNALIISVEQPETFKAVKEVIKLIDVKRKQVFISSTIIEVSNSNTFSFGADFGLKSNPGDGHNFGVGAGSSLGTAGLQIDPSNTANPVTLVPDPAKTGLNIAIPYKTWDVIPVVLNLAETDNNINVLATPSIICDDNEQAQIDITEERSFQTTQVSNNGTPITSHGGFNEAGIILKIKPTISSDKFLRLDIEQNVDRFIPSQGGRDVRNKRRASTIVTIPDNTTVVVGGLSQKQNSDGSSKVPFLSAIPVIGKIFQNKQKDNSNSTLYFFITPKIISDFSQLTDISDEYHKKLEDVAEESMKKDEIFINAKNDKVDREQIRKTMKDVLTDLYGTFNKNNLKRWVKSDRYYDLARAIISRRNDKNKTLLPGYTQTHFDKSRLDSNFVKTLDGAHKRIKDLPEEDRDELVSQFNIYLVEQLEKLANESQQEAKKKGKGSIKSSAGSATFKNP